MISIEDSAVGSFRPHHRSSYRNVLLLLLALAVVPVSTAAGPKGVKATQEQWEISGPGRDGKARTTLVTLTNRPVNTVDPGQNADDDAYYGKQYPRVGPADTRVNCAGDVANQLLGTGLKNFNVGSFRDDVIIRFGRVVQKRPQTNDVVIFGNEKHIAVITGVTSDPNVVIVRSKDNQESVREGKMSLDPRDWEDDPIINKNGVPTIYRLPLDKLTVHRVSPSTRRDNDGAEGEQGSESDSGKGKRRSSVRSTARDSATDAASDSAKQAARDAAKEAAEQAAKEAAKEDARDKPKDAAKEAAKPSGGHHHP